MKTREFKTHVYNELAAITKSLASPHRLEIIELLAQGARHVEYIAENTGLSIANASQHLQILKKARLVKAEKRGKYSYYSLATMKVYKAWLAMRELGFSQNAEINSLINEFRRSKNSLESVSIDELSERLKQQDILLLDVRPADEYEQGHIRSSISIPSEELTEKLRDLPKDKQIIAYCRGPLCAMADDAVQILQNHGFQSVRLAGGFPEWASRGLPVDHKSDVK